MYFQEIIIILQIILLLGSNEKQLFVERKKNQFLVYFIEIQESSMTIIQRRMRTFNKFEKVEE